MPESPEMRYADLLYGVTSERQLFRKILNLAEALGVRACSYRIRMPLPLSRPRSALHTTYPSAWRSIAPYQEFIHGDTEGWTDITADALRGLLELPNGRFQPRGGGPALREHAWGWRDARGVVALLTLVTAEDRHAGEDASGNLHPLARTAHAAMAEVMIGRLMPEANANITTRERQVLVWTAEGKSVSEISCILGISVSTVNFHVRNVIAKLRASNRAHAAVKAAVLGII